MAHPVISALVGLTLTSTPAVDLNAQSKDPVAALKSNPSLILIAQVRGDDPRLKDGKEPWEYTNPKDAPANKERDKYPAPKDPPQDDYKYKPAGRPY